MTPTTHLKVGVFGPHAVHTQHTHTHTTTHTLTHMFVVFSLQGKMVLVIAL